MNELVVARYQEDLRWLRRVPRAVRVTVYNKGGDGGVGHPLPNVGREAHTYLHHIVTRYDELAPVTVFCQGKPFDHVPDLHAVLRKLARGDLRVESFLWLGFVIDRDDRDGTLLFQRWSKNPEGRRLPMNAFWEAITPGPVPEEFIFYPGGNFAVTAEQVRRRPRAFYENALNISAGLDDAAHCFERCWDHVFGVDGIPAAHRDGPFPVYFKPIRRLMD